MVVELETFEKSHGDKDAGGEYYGEDEVKHGDKGTINYEINDKRIKK
jgi:hypothetical protein